MPFNLARSGQARALHLSRDRALVPPTYNFPLPTIYPLRKTSEKEEVVGMSGSTNELKLQLPQTLNWRRVGGKADGCFLCLTGLSLAS